jgi:hypothetical protein
MNCETCRGPVIGAGFFQRIVHERDCRKMKAYGEAFQKIGFPEQLHRCEICKENVSPMGLMCEDCTQELSEAKE